MEIDGMPVMACVNNNLKYSNEESQISLVKKENDLFERDIITKKSTLEYIEYPKEGQIIEIIEGSRRFSRVFVDEYSFAYLENKVRLDGAVILRCYRSKCSGTGVYIKKKEQFHRRKSHNHRPDLDSIKKWNFLKVTKERAENEKTPLEQIYMEEAHRCSGISLPTYSKLFNTLFKRRKSASNAVQESTFKSEEVQKVLKIDNDDKDIAMHFISQKEMEVIEGSKRHSKIYIDEFGYCYRINKKKDNNDLILRCHSPGCKGSGVCTVELHFERAVHHNHYADPLLVSKWRFLHRCKIRAEMESTPLNIIYKEEFERSNNSDLPRFKKIYNTLQKRRRDCKKSTYDEISNEVSEDKDEDNSDGDLDVASGSNNEFFQDCLHRVENESTPLKVIYDEIALKYDSCDIPSFENIETILQEKRLHVKVQKIDDCRCILTKDRNYSDLLIDEEKLEDPAFISCEASVPSMTLTCTSIKVTTGLCKDTRINRATLDVLSDHMMPNRGKRKTSKSHGEKSSGMGSCLKKKKIKRKGTLSSEKNPYVKVYKKISKVKKVKKVKSDYTCKMEVIEGKKRFSKVYIDEEGFCYRLNKNIKNNSTMARIRCALKDCCSSGQINLDTLIFKRRKEHVHEPDHSYIFKLKFLSAIKMRAESETTKLSDIYVEEKRRFPILSAEALPSYKMIESTLLKRRQAQSRTVDTIEEIMKYMECSDIVITSRGNLFECPIILKDRFIGILFVSKGDLEKEFESTEKIYISTDYRAVSECFTNLVVVHVLKGNHALPVVFALMSETGIEAYHYLLLLLESRYPSFNPSTISTDYNEDMENSIQTVFPTANRIGFWFPFVLKVWRSIQTNCLANTLLVDKICRNLLKKLMSVILLPASKINDAISLLRQTNANQFEYSQNVRNSIQSVIDYVEFDLLDKFGIHNLSNFTSNRLINYDLEALYHLFMKKLHLKDKSNNIHFIEKLVQLEDCLHEDYQTKQNDGKIRLDKSHRLANEKLIKNASNLLQSNRSTIDEFLSDVCQTVPQLIHFESNVFEALTTVQDPADVSSDVSVSEIYLTEPHMTKPNSDEFNLNLLTKCAAESKSNVGLAIPSKGSCSLGEFGTLSNVSSIKIFSKEITNKEDVELDYSKIEIG